MFLSIIAVWLAVVIMAAKVDDFSVMTAQLVASITTMILFVIGFRRK